MSERPGLSAVHSWAVCGLYTDTGLKKKRLGTMCPAFLPEEGRSGPGDLATRPGGKWSHSVGILLRKNVFMFEASAAGFFGCVRVKQTDKTRKFLNSAIKMSQTKPVFFFWSTPPHGSEHELMISHLRQPHPDRGRPAQHCHLLEQRCCFHDQTVKNCL